jgi:hypothetical protein
MSAIRIRKTIDSDTLTLPELRPLIGRTVEIIIDESITEDATAAEFWAEGAKLPTTQAEFAAQQARFRQWRTDPRFERHWPMIDRLLARDFERTRSWAESAKAVQGLVDYDYDAIRDQEACDLRDMQDMQERMQ